MANHRNNNYYICQARATLSPEDGSADDFGPREWKKLLAHEKQEWAAPDLSRVLGLAKQQVAGSLFIGLLPFPYTARFDELMESWCGAKPAYSPVRRRSRSREEPEEQPG